MTAALANAIAIADAAAAGSRWLTIGTVTAYSGGRITATIDGASVANIRRCTTWVTPANGDVALFAVVRGSASVQYIGIDKIAP